MNRYQGIGPLAIFTGALLLIGLWAGNVFAGTDAENFPAKIIYVPCYHSRPFFIKNFRPDTASPIKKVSINEPGIAEVKIITPYEFVIDGRYPGSTMCIIWYEDKSVDFLEVRVTGPRPYGVLEVEVIKGIKRSLDDSIIRGKW